MTLYLREVTGLILGYGMGLITGLLSALRMARVFHPSGILFDAKVESLYPEIIEFHEKATVTFIRSALEEEGMDRSIRNRYSLL